MARCHVVGLVTGRGRRVLHDHQADGWLAGLRRHIVGRVLLGGVFAPAVVEDAGDEEDEEEDDVTGHQDDEVQGDGVDLQVELHETHGSRFISRQLKENVEIRKEDGEKEQMTAMKWADEVGEGGVDSRTVIPNAPPACQQPMTKAAHF